MAIFCEKYNLLFIMTPRTASTAIGNLLLDELEGKYLPGEDVLDEHGNFVVQKKHGTLDQLLEQNILSRDSLDHIYVFTTVRNHFDNLYSLYMKYRIKYKPLMDDRESWVHRVPGYVDTINYCQNHSFDEWIDKYYGFAWYKRLIDAGHRSLYQRFTKDADFVIRFENLQDDFNLMLQDAGITRQLIIPRQNKTSVKLHTHYRKAYSDESRKIIEYVFMKELKRYGYQF